MNRIDQFLRDKLDGYELRPSDSAWSRVELSQTKKNKLPGWIWRAAALLILAGSVPFLINVSEQPQPALVVNKTAVPVSSQLTPENSQQEMTKQETKPKKRAIVSSAPEKDVTVEDIASAVKPQQTEFSESVIEPELPAVAQNNVDPPVRKPMKITYSLPTLPTQHTLDASTIAQHEPEKRTALQRALQAAGEWRNGDVFGQLRDAKDDFFYRTLRKEKKADTLAIE